MQQFLYELPVTLESHSEPGTRHGLMSTASERYGNGGIGGDWFREKRERIEDYPGRPTGQKTVNRTQVRRRTGSAHTAVRRCI